MEKLTQADIVLRHLQDFGKITSWDAIMEYGFTRISAIIYNLRKAGYNITSKTKIAKNRYGESTHFSEYNLEENA